MTDEPNHDPEDGQKTPPPAARHVVRHVSDTDVLDLETKLLRRMRVLEERLDADSGVSDPPPPPPVVRPWSGGQEEAAADSAAGPGPDEAADETVAP